MRKGVTKANVVLAVLALVFAQPARADDNLLGGLVGGMIGAAIINGANQQQRAQTARPATRTGGPKLSATDRQRNLEVQTALTYFGFDAGVPDGVLGSKSRAAISQYQALLSFAPTGTLAEPERAILVSAFDWARAGGAEVTKIAAQSPVGLRGVLLAQRDMVMGAPAGRMAAGYGGLPAEIAEAVDEVARNSGIEGPILMERAGFLQMADMNGDGRSDYLMDTAVTGSKFWCTGAACAVRVFVTTPTGFKRNDFLVAEPVPASFVCAGDACRLQEAPAAAEVAQTAPTPKAADPEGGTVMAGAAADPAGAASDAPSATPVATPVAEAVPLPSFGAALRPAQGHAAFCKGVTEATARRGKSQSLAAMDDPAQALGEQFCGVSAEAEAQGAALMAGLAGFTAEEIAQQCRGFAAALADQITRVQDNPRDTALSDVQAWLAQTKMPQDQLLGTAQVCLSVGYSSDDAGMALASALALAGSGNMVYGELVGHHLASGIGIARSGDLALEWFEAAASAVKAGQKPVFLSGEADRLQLVVGAAARMAGKASAVPLLPVVPVSAP